MRGKRAEDMTGRRFGRLVVEKRVYNGKRQPYWECRCDCGNICVVRVDALKTGATRSCGCIQRIKEKPRNKEQAENLSRFIDDDANQYQNLANAIVAVAANDYRRAIQSNDSAAQTELEEFFYSDWYSVLTNISADRMVRMLKTDVSGRLNAACV